MKKFFKWWLLLSILFFQVYCSGSVKEEEYQTGVTVTKKGNTTIFVSIGKSGKGFKDPFKRERASCDAAKTMAYRTVRETFPEIENILMLLEMKETRNLKNGEYCRIEYHYISGQEN